MNTIFAPILNSTQPAFNYLDKMIKINFNIPDYVNLSDIKHIGIQVIEQGTNQSVVDTNQWPDGIIYLRYNTTSGTNKTERTAFIYKDYLIQDENKALHWKPNTYYKIQMRFGTGALNISKREEPIVFPEAANDGSRSFEEFVQWKKNYLEAGYGFSEWSSVMLIKAIEPPRLKFLNAAATELGQLIVGSAYGTEYSTTPLFEVVYWTPPEEPSINYRFQLYNITNGEDKILEDSGWLTHNLSNDLYYTEEYQKNEDLAKQDIITSGDSYRFKTSMIYDPNHPITYKVKYFMQTLNGYATDALEYKFSILETEITDIPEALDFRFEVNNEDACINLSLSPKDINTSLQLSGLYVITRTSSKNNFSVWEDIQYISWAGEKFNTRTNIFTDYTVESGIKYRYGIQKQTSGGVRTSRRDILRLYSSIKDDFTALINFEHCYIYDNGIQLKLEYNNTISSFKHTKLMAKQDTLGSKYPVLMTNGDANYLEFPIGGLITMHMDINQHFLKYKKGILGEGFYYKDELIVPLEKLEPQARRVTTPSLNRMSFQNIYAIGTNLTYDTIYAERKFREKAEEFLNDGRYKLFKSPTEGNIIIGITNVSMTPNQQLGRMLYSFTSTAYEVLENTYENLVAYGIQNLGEKILYDNTPEYVGGQVHDLMVDSWKDINLIDIINETIKNKTADNVDMDSFKYILRAVDSIEFELFPQGKYQEELDYLQSQIIQYLITDPKLIRPVDTLQYEQNCIMKQRYESLIERLRYKNPIGGRVKIAIENNSGVTQSFYLGLGKKYRLDDLVKLYGQANAEDGLKISIMPWYSEKDELSEEIYPPIICNYTATAYIVENPLTTTKRIVSALSWGQLNGIFVNENKQFYEEQISNINNLNGQHPMNIYDNLKISDFITEQVKKQVAQAYNKTEENYFDSKQYKPNSDGTIEYYNSKEKSIYLSIIGYEMVSIETDPGNKILIIQDYKRDNNPYIEPIPIGETVVVGPTGRYELRYMPADDLEGIELLQEAHCIVDYQAQCYIEEKGVISK